MQRVGLFLCLTVVPIWSQGFTATLVGRTLDESGAVLPGVTVTVTLLATGRTRTATSDDAGNYAFLLLPPSEYTVGAEKRGFRKEVRKGIVLQVEQRAGIDLTLQVGEMTETIEIEGRSPLIQSETAAVGAVIDRKKIVELPLNGREFQQLAQLLPGTFPPAQGSSLSFRGGFHCAGTRETANYFLLDGIDNNNSAANQYTFRPSIDMIEEFKVQLSTYAAEFGRGAGGQINIITKSGTNTLHGNFFEFLRNSALDARNFFSLPGKQPPLRRNQFGATAGGPITIPGLYQGRNRSFFFFSYEGIRIRRGVTRSAAVPRREMVDGDFSSLLGAPRPIQILDPSGRRPFPDNRIPVGRIDRVGGAIARLYPVPNDPSDPVRNFVSSPSQPQDADQYSARVDHLFSSRGSLMFRYSINQDDQIEAFDSLVGTIGTNLPGFGRIDGQRTQSISLTYTRILSPRAVNEFRFGYNRLRQTRFPESRGRDMVGVLGLGGIRTDPRDFGFPAVRVTGFDPLGDSTQLPQGRADNTFHWVDNFSLIRGSHILKTGLDLRPFQSNNFNPIFARGDFRLTGLFSGFGLADLLLGLVEQTTRGVGDPARGRRQKSYGFYVQDDWKVTPALTFNLGLRYELNLPLYDVQNRMSSFDPSTRAILLAGRNGVRRSIFEPDRNNFAPRFGFAWQLPGERKTVIRGGYGVFYDLVIVGNELGALYFNAPFRSTQIFNGTQANPISLADPFPTQLVGAAALAPNGVQQDLRNSYLQDFSFGVQRELFRNAMVEVAYVGSKGTKLMRTRNINQAYPGPGSIASRRLFPGFGNINFRESSANSSFHSLQLRVEKRLSHGLSFLTAYTFSKSIDDASAVLGSAGTTNNPQNSHNLRLERALSDFDTRQRLVVSYIYELPLGRGKRYLNGPGSIERILGGWQVSGIAAFQSGNPFTPRLSRDVSGTGQLQDRPNLIGNPKLNRPDPALWFNTGAFAIPPSGTFGTAGRDILIGPGRNDYDFALTKKQRLGERYTLEFRAEFFNLLNHPLFNLPNAIADSLQFGKIFSASAARQIQFALRVEY